MKDTQILMHGCDKVAECKFDARGYLKTITRVYNEDLLPIGVDISKEGDHPKLDLQRWILARGLAVNRRDIAPLREFYGSDAFQTRNAISLFDIYWFADSENKDWEKINPYHNWNSKKDSIFLMFNNPEELREINYNSPNLTVPGKTQRLWYEQDKEFYVLHGDAQREMSIYKVGKGNSLIAKREYRILFGQIYAMTKSETNEDTEWVSFEEIYNSCKDAEKSKSWNIRHCCEKYGIPNWIEFFSGMSALDEKLHDDSRELCDVGVLRDTHTLEMKGFAKL